MILLTIVATGVDGKADLGRIVTRARSGLGPADWAGLVRVANIELIVVCGEGAQFPRLDLESSQNISWNLARIRQQCSTASFLLANSLPYRVDNTHLDSKVHIRGRIRFATIDRAGKCLVAGDLVLNANGCFRDAFFGVDRMSIERYVAADTRIVVDIVELRRDSGPEDD